MLPAADDDGDLHAAGAHGARARAAIALIRLRILAVGALAQQRLARELDQHAVERPAAVDGWGGIAHLRPYRTRSASRARSLRRPRS